MSTLAKADQPTGSALTLKADQDRWNEEQLAALHQLGLQNVPDGDLAVFLHVAQRSGLDPFAKQIHLIGRRSKEADGKYVTKYTIQTGIDGYRLTASRAAKREGDVIEYLDTEWCGPDGQWVDAWLNPNVPPAAARVVVVKNGRRYPGIAMYSEYVQTYYDKDAGAHVPNSMWTKMPAGQLAKCAEALAIRKAYPADFANLYTDDEMGQADNPAPAAPAESGGLSAVRARKQAEAAERESLDPGSDLAARLFAALDAEGVKPADRLKYIAERVGRPINGGADVTVGDAEQVLGDLVTDLPAEEPVDAELVPDEEPES